MILTVPSGTTLTYKNISGFSEAYAGTWKINAPYALEDDVNFERTDRRLIKGTTNYYDAVPTYERPSAVGTAVPANLSNIAGKTLDAFTEIVNVRSAAIKLRPDITAGDASLTAADETFTTTGYHFAAGDLNSFITITGSTDADGTYRIKTVTDGKTLELDGLASLTTESSITWKLESDIKGILSSRSYADAVDRRGIPIADTGAYDETNYDATFGEIVDPSSGGSLTDEAGRTLWVRAYGNAKDPDRTASNEGTRFFAQIEYGTNNGSATEQSLESISGRSGSVASLPGGNKSITGLSGMSGNDVGLWITIWNLAADEAEHYPIASVQSATQVTVTRGSNFTADASGAIKWQVSRHPGTFDFYTGDRYRLDQVSETARRTTLLGGIVTDAILTHDVAEIREFLGTEDGDTSPDLTNTGGNYIWSDVPNASDTSVQELLNLLNEQIGDRTYTGSVLTSGETVAASLQALSDAIDSSTITRIIEHCASAVPKNTLHSIPGGATFTPDGTNNGINLFVYWRGLLKNPGPLSQTTDTHYEEGTGPAATQIKPYEVIRQHDSINYFILQ
jgi:hypothetical protein